MPHAPFLSEPLTWELAPQRELSGKSLCDHITLLDSLQALGIACVFAFQFFTLDSQTLTTMYNLFAYYLYGLIDMQQATVTLYPIMRLTWCWQMQRLSCNLPL